MIRHIVLALLLILCIAVAPADAAKYWWGTCLTGGGDCLDGIDGASLSDGDAANVVRNNAGSYEVYTYFLNATSGASESSPSVISPDSNAGTKRWHLASLYGASTISPSANNPAIYFDETDGTDWWVGIDDVGNSLEFRNSATVGTSVQLELTESGVLTATGNMQAPAFVPSTAANAAGEIGYASNAFSWYANSEDLIATATSDMWTFSSGTSAAVTFTPAVTVTGTLTANGAIAANGSVTLGDAGDDVVAKLNVNTSDGTFSGFTIAPGTLEDISLASARSSQ